VFIITFDEVICSKSTLLNIILLRFSKQKDSSFLDMVIRSSNKTAMGQTLNKMKINCECRSNAVLDKYDEHLDL